MLLCAILDIDAARLITGARSSAREAAGALAAAVSRRVAAGRCRRFWMREFYGHASVTPATLDPAPEQRDDHRRCAGARDNRRPRPALAHSDVGTGTGCLLVALLGGAAERNRIGHRSEVATRSPWRPTMPIGSASAAARLLIADGLEEFRRI
jgi:methylase of polypeptide subunit release factors